MPAYPSAQRFLAQLNDVWTDLTDYWIDDLAGSWGQMSDGPADFLADPGVMVFSLNNMGQNFTPGHGSAMSGWKKGILARLEIDYDGATYLYLGSITDIDNPLGEDWIDKARVVVSDWLEYAARTPLINPAVADDQTGDAMITALAALIPRAPQNTDLATGVNTFATAFDTVTRDTKIYTELQKIALSELGPIYLRKDRTHGETLVFESAHDRHGWRALDEIPVATDSADILMLEDGHYLLHEDTPTQNFALDQVESFVLDNNMIQVQVDYGKNVLNYFSLTANPRRVDASPVVLFQLDEPVIIASGATIEIKGTYADPDGGLPVNGKDMIAPVATTDYLMNTARDGSGTNITANLTKVSTPYGAEGFTHQVRNDSAYVGYITKYNARGYGVYYYNPIDHVAQDSDSQSSYGYETESLDQAYQIELDAGALYVDRVVEFEREPRTVVRRVGFCPNQSGSLMMAALNFGPGNLIRVKHTARAIDSYFYILGVSQFKLDPGGLMFCEWVIKEIWSLLLGLSMLAIEFAGGSATDGVNFGNVKHINSQTQRSFSFWMYMDTAPVTNSDHIGGPFSDDKGVLISVTTDSRMQFYSKNYTTVALWYTPASSVSTGSWIHVVITYDNSSTSNDPVIYLNNSSQTLTETDTPAGSLKDEDGASLVIGNWKTATNDYDRAFDGKLKDFRVYNRILSAAEVSTLYNSGTPDASLVTDGLKFQAFCVRSDKYSDYEDTTLDDTMKVIDNIFGVVGIPHGSPVGRAP